MSAPDISLYDKYGYDYETYWKNRSYEHAAEVTALTPLLKNEHGKLFADIGGSFGRHIPLYRNNYERCVLLDYSIGALKKAQETIKQQRITNIFPIAANVYHLPFRKGSLDSALMVRVLHHLEHTDDAIAEISRTIKPGGSFVMEFANKMHIKAVLRALVRGRFKFLTSKEPHAVPFENPEGTTAQERGIMLNFHPFHIESLFVSHGMQPHTRRALSFFRIPLLKRIFPRKILVTSEKWAQRFFGWTTLTPSIVIKADKTPHSPGQPMKNNTISAKKSGSAPTNAYSVYDALHDILVCPACNEPLTLNSQEVMCTKCNTLFPVTEGILDLRYPIVGSNGD